MQNDKILITPEMIRAGVEVLDLITSEFNCPRKADSVSEIYRVMRAAASPVSCKAETYRD